GIFGKNARRHDLSVGDISILVLKKLEEKYNTMKFRNRNKISKKEVNGALKKIDSYLGQSLFYKTAHIKPDGGLIEVRDDNDNWRVVLVSEAKYQGKDIHNIKAGKLVGKKNDQDMMAAGNAIER